jgi:hypothetical protein
MDVPVRALLAARRPLTARGSGPGDGDRQGIVPSREEALAKLRGRYASTLDLLSEDEYAEGVAHAERELPDLVEYDLKQLIVIATR